MADYIERFAENGRRIRFPKDIPRAKQDEFLAQYGRDSGAPSVSQDQPMQNLAKMSGLPEGTVIPQDPRVEQIMSGQPQYSPQVQPQINPAMQRGAIPFQGEPEYAKYISKPGRPPQGKGLNPLDYEESAETFGRNEAEKRGASRIGPEIMASMMLGPAFGGAATGLGGAALRTLGHMATQGGIAAAFNPEDILKSSGTAAGITGLVHPLAEFLGSNNKYARMAKRAILPAATSGGAYLAADAAGAPWWAKPIIAALGHKAGSKLYSKLASRDALMMPAAEKILENMTPEAEKKYQLAKKLGVDLMPDEATGAPVLQAMRQQAGHTPQSISTLEGFQRSREGLVDSRFKDFLDTIYNPKNLESARKGGYSDVHASRIDPNDMTGIYKKPRVRAPKPIYEKPRVRVINEAESKPRIRVSQERDVSAEAADILKQYNRSIKGERKAIDPVIQESIDDMMRKAAYKKKFKGIPKEEVAYSGEFIDGLKKHIGEKAERLKDRGYGTEAFEQTDSLAKFLKQVDPLIDKYKQTRYLHELFATRGNMENLVKKGDRPNQALSKYLKDSDNKKDLIKSLRGIKDGRQYVKDLDSIFGIIEDVDVKSLHKRLPEQVDAGKKSTPYELYKSLMSSMKDGRFDEETVKLITSKDWPNKAKELSKITNKEKKAAKVFEYISKVGAKAARPSVKKGPQGELEIIHNYNEDLPQTDLENMEGEY
jgi:hypothetical protein